MSNEKIINILVPELGDNINVAEIFVTVNQHIKKDESIAILETDKASVEIPATCDGIIKEIRVKVGDKLQENSLIVSILAESDKNNISVTESGIINDNSTQEHKTNNTAYNNDYKNLISCDVVVLGSGPGGYTAAFRLADLGKKVILLEQYDTLGGVCLNVGCIPSKALLHLAKVTNDALAIKSHGIEFSLLNIDATKINNFKKNVVSQLTKGLQNLANKRNVTVIRAYGRFLDDNHIEAKAQNGDIQNIHFKNAIIAAGSHAFIPDVFKTQDPRIITSTGALNITDIPKKLLILGAGIIGLEMAEVYASFGSSVTIVEMGSQLIANCDRDLVNILETKIKKHYAAIYTNTKCENLIFAEDGVYVDLIGTDVQQLAQRFDKILIATGRRPNGFKLGLENTNVYVDKKAFIPVNNKCQTNIPHIYAIGDIVGNPMLAHKASYEAKIAAQNCANIESFFDAKAIPSVAYTDPEIAWVGLTEIDAKNLKIDIEIGKFPWAASGRAIASDATHGLTKIISCKHTKKILGGGIVGMGAGELIAEITLAIEMSADIHDLSLTIHAHPTLSESVLMASEIIDGTITDLYMPKKKK